MSVLQVFPNGFFHKISYETWERPEEMVMTRFPGLRNIFIVYSAYGDEEEYSLQEINRPITRLLDVQIKGTAFITRDGEGINDDDIRRIMGYFTGAIVQQVFYEKIKHIMDDIYKCIARLTNTKPPYNQFLTVLYTVYDMEAIPDVDELPDKDMADGFLKNILNSPLVKNDQYLKFSLTMIMNYIKKEKGEGVNALYDIDLRRLDKCLSQV